VWGLSQQQAFDELKNVCAHPQYFHYRTCNIPLRSRQMLQTMLWASFSLNTDHPVAYHSETLSDVVRKYPTYDKEMYSIVQAFASGDITFLGRRQSSTLITSHYSSCRPKENCRMTAIRSGPHTYNSSTSTSSIKQEVPTELLISSADLQS
jgi:hypothetical protein